MPLAQLTHHPNTSGPDVGWGLLQYPSHLLINSDFKQEIICEQKTQRKTKYDTFSRTKGF
jgi:hypothetical protein